MINLEKIILGTPILITNNHYFYQPTLREIIEMDSKYYWSLLNIWALKRSDLIEHETEETKQVDDFDIWKQYIFSSAEAKKVLIDSIAVLLKEKIDFLAVTNTIIIGEDTNRIFLDSGFYMIMRTLCQKLFPDGDNEEQYAETTNMSDREKEMVAKMKARQKTLQTLNGDGSDPADSLGKKIVGLVAIGHYTFEEVYSMTMLQFNLLLQKYIDIEAFELTTALSPYMDSKKSKPNKFWLD